MTTAWKLSETTRSSLRSERESLEQMIQESQDAEAKEHERLRTLASRINGARARIAEIERDLLTGIVQEKEE